MELTETEQRIVDAMKSLNTWKPEFFPAVKICADLMDQYNDVNGRIVSGELRRFDVTETGGTRKSAAVTMTECLRRDILSYLKELGLTTLAVKRLDAQENLPESSVLAEALRKFGEAG